MSTRTNSMESAMPGWRQFAVTAFLVLFGAVVSLVLFWAAYSWEMRSIRRDFDALADARCKEVSNALQETATLLDFIDNVFIIAPQVNDPSFAGYLHYLGKILEADRFRHPEIVSLIWAPRVSGAERAAYEQAAKAAIDARFQIGKIDTSGDSGATEKPAEHFPIYLCVAAQGNHDNLGEDITLDPAAREVVRRSADTGIPLALAPIKLSTGARGDFGYRIYQPLYNANVPGEPQDRRQSLTGFLCVDLDVGRLIDNAMKNIKPVGIDFQIYENNGGTPVILYRHSSRLTSPSAAEDRNHKELESNWTTEFFGRKLQIRCRTSPAFWVGRTIWQPWVVLCGGLALTLLGAGYQFKLAFQTRAVERAVTKRIAKLNEEIVQRQKAQWQRSAKPSLAEMSDGELQKTAVSAKIGDDDAIQ
jgi:CHASE1-domain containing sensor protein